MTPDRIVLIGRSRAGRSVARALQAAGHVWTATWNRTPWAPGADAEPPRLETLDVAPARPTLVILAVADDGLAAVARALAAASGAYLAAARPLVIHLSGSASLEVLADIRVRGATVGSLHPLRSFPEAARDGGALAEVACGVAGDPAAHERLSRLLSAAGGRPLVLPSAGKARYHLAAAVASNHVVAVLDMAVRQMTAAGVPAGEAIEALGALAAQAVERARALGPELALTGPIARGDVEVVRRHLESLEPGPDRLAYLATARLVLDLARRSAPRDGHDELARLLDSAAC